MPQPALDAIAGNGVSERPTDNEPNPRPGTAKNIPLRPNISNGHGMDNQGRSTRSNPSPRSPLEVLRVVHPQSLRQHRNRSGTNVRRTDGCGPCGAGQK
jgi:hypothetical protein